MRYAKLGNPFVQALFILLYLGIGLLISATVLGANRAEWFIGATAILLFTVFTSLLSIFCVRWKSYALKSTIIFIVLFPGCYVLGGVLQNDGFAVAGEYNLLYLALAVFFFGTMGIAVAIRTAISLLKAAD